LLAETLLERGVLYGGPLNDIAYAVASGITG
jgi:hypothetical protein